MYITPLSTESVAAMQSAPSTCRHCTRVCPPLSLHDDPVRRVFMFSFHRWETKAQGSKVTHERIRQLISN